MTAPTPAQTQREHDADDLVTEEMVESARAALRAHPDFVNLIPTTWMRDVLLAVAPMIAARAFEQCRHIPGLEGKFAWRVGAREEREACAKIAENRAEEGECGTWQAQEGLIIAAAIRARGETT
jgi:hypothetical protein